METLAPTLAAESASRGARLVAIALLHDLERERPRLDDRDDAEALHDFRVALRRLRSWLRLLRVELAGSVPRGVRRELKRWAKTSNAGRDAEVFAAWLEQAATQLPRQHQPAVRWLRRQQDARRKTAGKELGGELDDTFESTVRKLERRLSRYRTVVRLDGSTDEPPLAVVLRDLAQGQAKLLRQQLQQVHASDDEEQAHRARIAGKRLRYLLEPVAPHLEDGKGVIDQLKELQDTFGALHDAHVWGTKLKDALEEAAREEGRALARVAAGAAPARRRSRMPSRRALGAVAGRMHEDAARAFVAARERWLGDASAPFFDRLDQAGEALVALGTPPATPVEIERKYLLTALPAEMPEASVEEVVQGYLPGQHLHERLRARTDGNGTRYLRTVKLGSGVTRTEVEEETTPAVFELMWPLTAGRRVRKRRHVVPNGSLSWEIDEFTDRDLVLAELELPAADHRVELPEWLAPYVVREVTEEPEFVNVNLAK